jgi:hypothetical protein
MEQVLACLSASTNGQQPPVGFKAPQPAEVSGTILEPGTNDARSLVGPSTAKVPPSVTEQRSERSLATAARQATVNAMIGPRVAAPRGLSSLSFSFSERSANDYDSNRCCSCLPSLLSRRGPKTAVRANPGDSEGPVASAQPDSESLSQADPADVQSETEDASGRALTGSTKKTFGKLTGDGHGESLVTTLQYAAVEQPRGSGWTSREVPNKVGQDQISEGADDSAVKHWQPMDVQVTSHGDDVDAGSIDKNGAHFGPRSSSSHGADHQVPRNSPDSTGCENVKVIRADNDQSRNEAGEEKQQNRMQMGSRNKETRPETTRLDTPSRSATEMDGAQINRCADPARQDSKVAAVGLPATKAGQGQMASPAAGAAGRMKDQETAHANGSLSRLSCSCCAVAAAALATAAHDSAALGGLLVEMRQVASQSHTHIPNAFAES